MGRYLDAFKQKLFSEMPHPRTDNTDESTDKGDMSVLSVGCLAHSEKKPPDPANPFALDLGEPLDPAHRWGFLFNCPFTRRMLEVAAELWREPLDADDLADIEHGTIYLFEQRQAELQTYLGRWADEHPYQLHMLRADDLSDAVDRS